VFLIVSVAAIIRNEGYEYELPCQYCLHFIISIMLLYLLRDFSVHTLREAADCEGSVYAQVHATVSRMIFGFRIQCPYFSRVEHLLIK
jgi:hypothetical protein